MILFIIIFIIKKIGLVGRKAPFLINLLFLFRNYKLLLLYGFLLCSSNTIAQNLYNSFSSPYLIISPDPVGSGKGETGVATQPDYASLYWNPSKIVFNVDNAGFFTSYTPWLTDIHSGIYRLYFQGFNKINPDNSLAYGIDFFNIGGLSQYDEYGTPLGTLSPNDYSFQISYSRRFGLDGALGITAKYIHSDLALIAADGTATFIPSHTLGFDLGWYLQKELINGHKISFGISALNIGPKLKVSEANFSQFLPMNLRWGFQYDLIHSENVLNLSIDFNKYLLPTLPIYKLDTNGHPTSTILKGQDPNKTIPSAIFGSFSDAPYGLSQELKEIQIGIGLDYCIQNALSVRTGYHYQNKELGGLSFATLGFGYKDNRFGFDLSYNYPIGSQNLYKDTFRISLNYRVESKPKPSH